MMVTPNITMNNLKDCMSIDRTMRKRQARLLSKWENIAIINS